jgi:hypothetical protein
VRAAVETPEQFQFRKFHAELELPTQLEALLALEGARVVCRGEEQLRAREPVELQCRGATLAEPRASRSPGSGGDPQPSLVSVILAESRQHRHPARLGHPDLLALQPTVPRLGDRGSTSALHAFIRIERR